MSSPMLIAARNGYSGRDIDVILEQQMHPTARSARRLTSGLTRRSMERKPLVAERMDTPVEPAYGPPSDLTALQPAPAKVETRDVSHFVRHLDGGLARMEVAVEGIVCAACMRTIEDGLAAIADLTLARVNLADRRVAVEWRDGKVDPVRFLDRLSELGYRAYPYDASRSAANEQQETYTLLRCLGVAAFAATNIMLLSVAVWSGNVADIAPEQRDFFHWLSALIALPAAAYAGRPFFNSAVRALAAGRTNMDVPISVGVVLALGMSLFETLHHATHAYFDSALMLLTFLLVGRTLEETMARRARAFAGNLAARLAETVTKFVSDTELAEVPECC
jgi:Cu2+-exporting ATPase